MELSANQMPLHTIEEEDHCNSALEVEIEVAIEAALESSLQDLEEEEASIEAGILEAKEEIIFQKIAVTFQEVVSEALDNNNHVSFKKYILSIKNFI